MNFDESFPKRVSIARNALGLTQSELAKKVGVVPRQIAAYEGGEAKPRSNALQNLAAALGATVDWLASGKGNGPDTSHIKRTITVREIPLLAHAQVMGIGFDFDDFIKSASASDFIPAPPDAGEYAFAIEVHGNSMDSPSGISFPHGTIIIIDPEIMPENGDFGLFVLHGHGEDAITFKQYIRDQGKGYLRALNPDYPLIEASLVITPIGKVISAQQSFSTRWNVGESSILSDKLNPPSTPDLQSRLDALDRKLDAIIEILASNKKPT